MGEDFSEAKGRLTAGSRASTGDDLLGMEIDIATVLEGPFLDVDVRRTGDPQELLLVTGRAHPDTDAAAVAAELAALWTEYLRYSYAAEHRVTVGDALVRLDAVTKTAADGYFVTATFAIEL